MTLNVNNPTIIFTGLFTTWVMALFFNGLNVEQLIFVQLLLLTTALMTSYQLPNKPLTFPLNNLTIIFALFWLWIIIAPNWSLSPHTSNTNAWIISLLPVTFFIIQFSRLNEKHWYYFSYAILIPGTLLALHAIYQVSFTHQQATSIFFNRNSLAALLNLITLVSIGFLLIQLLKKPFNKHLIIIAIAILIITYAIGLTQSRGAVISLYIALSIFLFSTRKYLPLKLSLTLVALITLTIFMPNFHVSDGDIASRLQTLSDPYSAGANRFYIWESTWEMIKTSLWLGIGAGMFWFVYPQYRSSLDTSGGYYIHNDYLQIWLENGLPALVLLCCLFIMVLIRYIKTITRETDTYKKIELTGIFSGLFAISLHSLVTFNYYIISILILCGIFLARFNQLCLNKSDKFITINIKNKSAIFLTLISIIFFFIGNELRLNYFTYDYNKQAQPFIASGNYVVADDLLRKATESRHTEKNYLTHAYMLLKLLAQTPAHAKETKQNLFNTALSDINKAASLNSHRSYLYLLKGRLYAENPKFVKNNSHQQAEIAFLKSLELDPRQFRARYALALLYLRNNMPTKGAQLLNEGLKTNFMRLPINKMPYLQLNLRLNQKAGDINTVNAMALLIQKQLTKRKKLPSIAEIINNVVNSGSSGYNFDEYDKFSNPKI
ncbi:MAG: O-antigen ligase family protein [Sulfuriflexus sp.]|nr:O-antigen ligase family protein [Sulfuriflexus sp.]